MFRFTLAAFAFLAGCSVSAALPSCSAPQVVEEAGTTVFGAGSNWQEQTDIDMGASEVWYSLTVAKQCEITIAMNSCTVGSPNVTIAVFEDTIDCNNLPTSIKQNQGACGGLIPGDLGAALSFPHDDDEETTYLIQVRSADGSDFVFPGAMEINVQGVLSGTCKGDPHFTRWGQKVRDSFHGECDLVLLHQDDVAGEPVDVHVRTTMKDSYSYVSGVAVKYGDDNLEFQHDALFINGAKVEDEEEIVFGDDNKIVMVDSEKRKFSVNIKDEIAVEVFSTKKFMGVSVHGGKHENMEGSTGILGEYGTGNMIARDGSLIEDFQNYGFEWQVAPSDPQIFMHAREPQLPYERCRMPSISAESRRRKLRGQDRKLYEAAVAACQENQIPENMQSCVDDVMFTGELDLALV